MFFCNYSAKEINCLKETKQLFKLKINDFDTVHLCKNCYEKHLLIQTELASLTSDTKNKKLTLEKVYKILEKCEQPVNCEYIAENIGLSVDYTYVLLMDLVRKKRVHILKILTDGRKRATNFYHISKDFLNEYKTSFAVDKRKQHIILSFRENYVFNFIKREIKAVQLKDITNLFASEKYLISNHEIRTIVEKLIRFNLIIGFKATGVKCYLYSDSQSKIDLWLHEYKNNRENTILKYQNELQVIASRLSHDGYKEFPFTLLDISKGLEKLK